MLSVPRRAPKLRRTVVGARVVDGELGVPRIEGGIFHLHDQSELRGVLAARDDIDATENETFVWLDAEDPSRSPGTWRFDRDRLVLETISLERDARGREWRRPGHSDRRWRIAYGNSTTTPNAAERSGCVRCRLAMGGVGAGR
jgi:hypothetical protein